MNKDSISIHTKKIELAGNKEARQCKICSLSVNRLSFRTWRTKEAVAILLSKTMLTHTIVCALIYSNDTKMSRIGVTLYMSQLRACHEYR